MLDDVPPPLPARAGAALTASRIVTAAMVILNIVLSLVAAPKGAPSTARRDSYRQKSLGLPRTRDRRSGGVSLAAKRRARRRARARVASCCALVDREGDRTVH